MKKLHLFILTFLLSALFSCNGTDNESLSADDRKAIDETFQKAWSDLNNGDWSSYINLYGEDAVIMPPYHKKYYGTKGIRQYLTDKGLDPDIIKKPNLIFKFKLVEAWGSPDEARIVGDFSYVLPNGKVFSEGKSFAELKKDKEGNWKVTHSMWNCNQIPPWFTEK